MRIGLLMSIAWIVRLTAPLFTVFGQEISGRDLILIGGGLFLLGKATLEIHDRLEGEEAHGVARVAPSFGAVIAQIMLLDIVFSLDSVITAVGMADDISIMVAAVVLSVGIMMFSAEPISAFVSQHPTVKVLALSFLLLIGMSLIGDGLGMHMPKGYIYFAMGFSVFVEMINLRVRKGAAAGQAAHAVLTTETRKQIFFVAFEAFVYCVGSGNQHTASGTAAVCATVNTCECWAQIFMKGAAWRLPKPLIGYAQQRQKSSSRASSFHISSSRIADSALPAAQITATSSPKTTIRRRAPAPPASRSCRRQRRGTA